MQRAQRCTVRQCAARSVSSTADRSGRFLRPADDARSHLASLRDQPSIKGHERSCAGRVRDAAAAQTGTPRHRPAFLHPTARSAETGPRRHPACCRHDLAPPPDGRPRRGRLLPLRLALRAKPVRNRGQRTVSEARGNVCRARLPKTMAPVEVVVGTSRKCTLTPVSPDPGFPGSRLLILRTNPVALRRACSRFPGRRMRPD